MDLISFKRFILDILADHKVSDECIEKVYKEIYDKGYDKGYDSGYDERETQSNYNDYRDDMD